MKYLIKLIIIALVLFAADYASPQGSWQRVNTPMSGDIVSILVDGNNIYTGNQFGIIDVSTNNGTSWSHYGIDQSSGSTTTPEKIVKSSTGTLFVSTQNGVYRSVDNGVTWIRRNNGLTISPVGFITINSAGELFVENFDVIYKSTNNGDTWQPTPGFNSFVFDMDYHAASNSIYIGSEGGLFVSSNNGGSWSQVPGISDDVYEVAFSGQDIYAATRIYDPFTVRLLRSTNNGASWQELFDEEMEAYPLALDASGPDIYFSVDKFGVIRSSNGGASWENTNPGFITGAAEDIKISGNAVYAATLEKGLFKTTNNGSQWFIIGTIPKIFETIASKDNTLLAGLFYEGIMISEDNGANWDQLGNELNRRIECIKPETNGNIYVGTQDHSKAGSQGQIYFTANNGQSYSNINGNIPENPIYDIEYAQSGFLFAATEELGIFRSSNNGASWVQKNTGLGGLWVNSIFEAANGNLFASASAFTTTGLYRSSDNGDSWSFIGFDTLVVTNMIQHRDGALIAGTHLGSTIYRSTDNGNTWTPGTGIPRSITMQLVNAPNGNIYAATLAGVFRSVDAGITWTDMSNGIDDLISINGLTLMGNYLYVSNQNNIFRMDVSTAITPIGSEIPGSFSLSQNYPNPFNPSTTIRFSIPVESNIKLSVFDAAGRQISVIVNAELKAGYYQFSFNGSTLSSGIYFYRLQGSSFSETKKMLLVK